MKMKFITTVIRNHKKILPAVAVTGNILMAPFAAATTYNSTVNIDNTPLVDGDSIVISGSNANGFKNGNGGTAILDLGNGRISVDLSTSANSSLQGGFLGNNQSNNLGDGTSIKINQTTTGNKTPFVYGLYLAGSTALKATNLDIGITSTTNAIGIDIRNSGIPPSETLNLGDGSKINVTSTRTYAMGIRATTTSTIKANGLDIHVISESSDAGASLANGISLDGGGVLDLGYGSKITSEAINRPFSAGSGITLKNSSTLRADALTIKGVNTNGINIYGQLADVDLGSNSVITTDGAESKGIYAISQDTNIRADRLTVATTGFLAHGLDLGQGTRIVDLGNDSAVSTLGDNAVGIKQYTSANAHLKGNNLTVYTQGANANAVEISAGKATLDNGGLLMADQSGALLVSSAGTAALTGTTLSSGGTYGAKIEGNATFTGGETQIRGNADYGIWANGGKADLNNYAVYVDNGGTGLYSSANGRIYLTDDIVVQAQSGKAMLADGANAIITQVSAGKATISGQLIADNGGRLNLATTAGSYINGSANQFNGGAINLSMDDGYWIFDNDSDVSSLMLANDSRVAFNTSSDGTLTVNALSGNGLFHMRTDIAGGSGDLIDVLMSTAGNHQLNIVNRGSAATDGTETLVVVQTADGHGNFDLTHEVEAGGYLYGLRQTGNDWELYATGKISLPADASVSFLNAGYLMNYAEMQTLLQRMGDLRQGADSGNLWVRSYYGNFDSFSGSMLSGFDMTYNGLQIGGDKAFNTDRGQLYTGAFVGLVDSNQRYSHGHGKIQSKSLGLYAAYMFNSGAYVDTVVKYQNFRNKLSVSDSQGESVNGRGSSNGFTASIEAGHRLFLEESRTGSFVEPQLQVSYGWQDSATVTNSNGLKVDMDSYNSLLGRAGLLLGYEVDKPGKAPVTFYFKNSWLHEFSGDSSYALNGAKESHSFKGGAWVSGVGASTKVFKNHVAYLDMEHTNGKRFAQNQINVGYRYSF
jgi:outer membrane autotransporter protein